MGTVQQKVEGISARQAERWRREVEEKREELFRRNWKNRRNIPILKSKGEAEMFQFIIEWCDEYDELVDRNLERRRLDKLMELGLDVNAPREDQPLVV